jgi:hypothetical protein
MRAALLLVLAFLGVHLANAQDPKPLDQLKREEQADKTMELIDQARAQIEQMSRRFRSDYEKAIGRAGFCDCLRTNLPAIWSFDDYIAIATKSKDQTGYARMDTDLKRAYDSVVPIRDRCVKAFASRRRGYVL